MAGAGLARPAATHTMHAGALEYGAIRAGPEPHVSSRRLGVLSLARGQDGTWELVLGRLEGSLRLSCEAIVDATGRNAVVARRLGAERVWADKLVAVQCEVKGAWLAGTSFVATGAAGYWYAAPGSDDSVVVLLFTDGDLLHSSGLREPACLLSHWRACRALSERLPPPERLLGKPVLVSAPSAFSRRAGGAGWVAVAMP